MDRQLKTEKFRSSTSIKSNIFRQKFSTLCMSGSVSSSVRETDIRTDRVMVATTRWKEGAKPIKCAMSSAIKMT